MRSPCEMLQRVYAFCEVVLQAAHARQRAAEAAIDSACRTASSPVYAAVLWRHLCPRDAVTPSSPVCRVIQRYIEGEMGTAGAVRPRGLACDSDE